MDSGLRAPGFEPRTQNPEPRTGSYLSFIAARSNVVTWACISPFFVM